MFHALARRYVAMKDEPATHQRNSQMKNASVMIIANFYRKVVEHISEAISVLRNLILDVSDSYRPELHYMRGPGPKWNTKHSPR